MDQVLITRKIEVIIDEEDPKKQKEMLAQLFKWRKIVRTAANIIVSHKFIQKNVADFEYLKDETKKSVFESDIIKDGKGLSVQNVTYRKLVQIYGSEIPHDILASLNQMVSTTFNKTYRLVREGNSSVRNYKNDIPIPFPAAALRQFKEVKNPENGKFEHYSFIIHGIPFKTHFGKYDKSNNRALIGRCFDENYPDFVLRASSIVVDTSGDKLKIFLLACVKRPKTLAKTVKDKKLYALLSVNTPIICSSNHSAIPYMSDYALIEQRQNLLELASQMKEFDKELGEKTKNEIDDLYTNGKGKFPYIVSIGTKEEFLHRRIQIQRAVRRCQKDNRYASSGKGRKRKCQAIERWHKIEHNYVQTKIHTYAKLLVMEAKRQECSTIVLCKQEERELEAKAEHKAKNHCLLRNWSYYGLKDKITYKAAQFGIKVVEELSAKSLVVHFEGDDYNLVDKFCKKISGKKFKVTSESAKIPNMEEYDIVYLGMTGIGTSTDSLVESFITNNIEPSQTIVPFICGDNAAQAAAVEKIKSTFPSMKWWNELIKMYKNTDKDMKVLQKTISDSIDL